MLALSRLRIALFGDQPENAQPLEVVAEWFGSATAEFEDVTGHQLPSLPRSSSSALARQSAARSRPSR
jgi:hypothetical protein